jgi:hypothetical protein
MVDDPKSGSQIFYEIRVAGRLNPEWTAWFEGMQIFVSKMEREGTVTIMRGCITDQAALFGTLARIRDLGLKLISVNRMMSKGI